MKPLKIFKVFVQWWLFSNSVVAEMLNIISQQDYDQRFDHKKHMHEVVPDVLMCNQKVKQVKICIDLEWNEK